MSSISFRRILHVSAIAAVVASFVFFINWTRTGHADTSVVEPADAAVNWPLTPAGRLLLDKETGLPAVTPLTMNFVRTPDKDGTDGRGRYLIAVNSGYGVFFTSKSKAQQTLSVIDLNAKPDPQITQNVYFPSPQSANFGLVFDQRVQPDGKYRLYLAGGYENKIWILSYDPKAAVPLAPQNKPDEKFDAPFIDVSSFAETAPSPNYNGNVAAVYPTGLALWPDGNSIYVANNLGDSLGIVSDIRDTRAVTRIPLRRPDSAQFTYPYDVKQMVRGNKDTKTFVSLWGDGSVAVIGGAKANDVRFITVDRHPTAMLFNKDRSRLYVVNSDADSVSVIDTRSEKVVETINLRLAEGTKNGESPEGLALSEDEKTLYVANAHVNAVAVVKLGQPSKLAGFIPTGNYPSAIACIGNKLFIANGKGTGMENSSLKVNDTGLYPNIPNANFPGGANRRGMYSASIVSGNISLVDIPDEKQLFAFTQQVMKNTGLLGREKHDIFPGGKSPFKHVIYIIRENRTYDQIFGDLAASGNGQKADGDSSVAIFGAGDAAKSPSGQPQNITPNARAIAQRFGLFDRFFVNAEASPDGHNWSDAAFSSDYVDKAFRWNYSGRGRTYDFEGVNRMPGFEPPTGQPPVALPPVFELPVTAETLANYAKKYIPYLHGARDIGEPESLYLWDAAARSGLSYRNYGEFCDNVSEARVKEINEQKFKPYPDTTANATAFPTKKSLEGHFAPQARTFDLLTPDVITTDSYTAALANSGIDPAITNDNSDNRFRGMSRFGAWRDEFRSFVADLEAGHGDKMPNLSILQLPNDHTAGLSKNRPTPQFYVAENDYALGRVVEEVSKSPYWKDTAIFVVEDDAQDGPDHVDAHRSPGLVISAYNRPGALVHEFHNTVSLIRTLELCIGLEPMNFLDSNAIPIDIFTDKPDLRPFNAILPTVALDNLFPPAKPSAEMAYYMRLTDKQDLSREDRADPSELNEIIWYSVRGKDEMPGIASLPAYQLMKAGLKQEAEREKDGDDDDVE